jgi:diamine N-acetyltransferase
LTDNEAGSPLKPSHPAFGTGEYLLRSCSLRPLPPDLALPAARQLVGLDPWQTLGYRAESLAHYLQRSDASLYKFLVLAAGQSAGVVCCRYPWLFGPFLELLAVYPQFQGQGVGREIIGWLENQPGAYTNIWTTVSTFNVRAMNFYTKHGYREVGQLTDLVRAGYDEIFLRKIIREVRPKD